MVKTRKHEWLNAGLMYSLHREADGGRVIAIHHSGLDQERKKRNA